MAILTSEKVNFRIKTIARNKINNFIMMKG